jgi:3-phosphoshikimate 1-carboxyvinyltransferase
LRSVSHIRGHETDRIAALTDIAERIGAACRDDDGDLVIEPVSPPHLRAASHEPAVTIATYDDHRLATAGAIIGLRRAHVLVENIATTGKTMPDFPAMWESLVSAR